MKAWRLLDTGALPAALNMGVDLALPWHDLPPKARHALLYGTGETHITFTWRGRHGTWKHGGTYEGVIAELQATPFRGSICLCPCGNPLPRHDHLLGRSDDMLIIKGVNVFPSQIEEGRPQQRPLAENDCRPEGWRDGLHGCS
ncbi:MAG: hypothetical protein HGB17_11810 [Syntrophobacteraceae bacterium]|nr:hypothetical protein [Syntrophobacteraceae bacterium]